MSLEQELEYRSALPIETRDEGGGDDDALIAATRAVEELRQSTETFRTEQTQATEQRATEMRQLTDRLAKIETRINRPGTTTATRENETPVETRAFNTFVRRGREAMGAEEVRALRASDNMAGGFLVPDQFEAELIRNLVEISPIRQAARASSIAGASITLPKRTGRITARWVGEIEERPATQPTFGQIYIEPGEIACYVDVSNALLEDAALNMEAELRFDFTEEFGRAEGEAFIKGDGIKKPRGVMMDPSIQTVPTGAASEITSDSLIAAMYDLPAYYRNRGSWLMNGHTIGKVRSFKGADGHYLWQESLRDGEPPTLLGRPVIEATDMPDVAAGSTPIMFGDMASAYRIVDRLGLSILRDPFTQATEGMTRFHARRRVGGGVVRAEALRKLRVATA